MIRLDRFLTLALFRYLARPTHNKGLRIPILMYHSISCDAENTVHPYYRVNTSPQVFAAHMRQLHESGYQVITLDDAIRLLCAGNDSYRTETNKLAVITFDDGFLDFYTEAFPILSHYGFTATVFLPTLFINDTNATICDKSFLSWPQVRELANAGISFGSHSVSHKYLAELSKEQVEQELRVSKETIEHQTGKAVLTFSYPFAYPENDNPFVSFMSLSMNSSGYSGAVTTRVGTASTGDDLFCLKRIPVNAEDDISLFRAKMAGSYDWLHTAQYMAKSVKGMLGMRRRKNLVNWSSPC